MYNSSFNKEKAATSNKILIWVQSIFSTSIFNPMIFFKGGAYSFWLRSHIVVNMGEIESG